MSRIVVGVFALVLTGGLAGFFSGAFDSLIGKNEAPVNKPPMPFAKPQPAYTPKTAAVNPAPPATPAPAPTVKQVPVVAAVTPSNKPTPTVVAQTEVVAPTKAEVATELKTEKAIANTTPPKPLADKPARQRNLDLRSCLELTDNLAIAQCAYKQP
ncbi:MAG: hypothetical protein HOO95_00195 [Gallionella sp.]|nr:hypothetical protein [Gallionella sp.]